MSFSEAALLQQRLACAALKIAFVLLTTLGRLLQKEKSVVLMKYIYTRVLNIQEEVEEKMSTLAREDASTVAGIVGSRSSGDVPPRHTCTHP